MKRRSVAYGFFGGGYSMGRRLSLVLIVLVCGTGCGQSKADKLKEAEAEFMSEAEKLAWYGPAREALILHIERWHREKGTPVPSASQLSKFVEGPLRFTVGGGKFAVQRQLEWTAIKLQPVGKDAKDKRFYKYKIELAGTEGLTGVEGLRVSE